MFAGMARSTEPYEVRDMTVTDTDALLRAAGIADDDLRDAARGRGDRVSETKVRDSDRTCPTTCRH